MKSYKQFINEATFDKEAFKVSLAKELAKRKADEEKRKQSQANVNTYNKDNTPAYDHEKTKAELKAAQGQYDPHWHMADGPAYFKGKEIHDKIESLSLCTVTGE